MSTRMTLVAERPVATAPRPWHFPRFERSQVAGGQVIACHLPGRPLAVVSVVLDSGAAGEPAELAGVGELVARALSEGTTVRDAYGFAVAGERLGASWRASTDWDSMRCGFEVPTAELTAATELLTEALRTPALDTATLTRIRDERLDEIQIERSQPAARGMEQFAATAFVEPSRYAVPDAGTLKSVGSVSDDDIRRHHQRIVAAPRATLVVVGDLDDVDVGVLGRIVFDGWHGRGELLPLPDVTPRSSGRRIGVVDRPGSVQSMLCVGHDGPARSASDYVAFTTMSLTLGGMFGSRLNLKLREEKGYAYGAFGGFDTRRDGGVFVCRAAVQTEVTVPALVDLVAEIERMQAGGVEPDELEQARAYRAGVFPLNFAGSLPVAAALGDVVVHGLPDDHYDRLRARVLDIGKDEVDAAATHRLRPDDLSIVVVGDAASVLADLRAADLGPVEVVADED